MGSRTFSVKNNLKIDGIAKPGGETEAALVSTLMKLPKPKSSKEDEKYGYQTASVIPLLGILGLGLGMSAAGAAQWWMSENNADKREKILKSFQKSDESTSPHPDNDSCYDEYERDINECKRVGKSLNYRAQKACEETAILRYTQCIKNIPPKERRNLQTEF